jgi:hypothetical protein
MDVDINNWCVAFEKVPANNYNVSVREFCTYVCYRLLYSGFNDMDQKEKDYRRILDSLNNDKNNILFNSNICMTYDKIPNKLITDLCTECQNMMEGMVNNNINTNILISAYIGSICRSKNQMFRLLGADNNAYLNNMLVNIINNNDTSVLLRLINCMTYKKHMKLRLHHTIRFIKDAYC